MTILNTETPVISPHVRKLIREGRGPDIMKAIDMEQKSNNRSVTYKGITVRRIC